VLKLLEKIAEILTVAMKPVLKRPLMDACNLSNLTFNVYITQLLLPLGLLDAFPAVGKTVGRPTRHRMLYQTSQQGEKFLEVYKQLEKLLTP